MLFKQKPAFLFLVSAFLLVGCAGEDQPYHDVPVVNLKSASCLSASTKKIEKFFEGDATPGETDEIWDCFSTALNTFGSYVKGAEENRYTALELRQFLETYFIESRPRKSEHAISDELLDEMMEIKRLFLGGSRLSVTKAEILKTLTLIEKFRSISHKLRPHNKILFQNENFTPTVEQLEAATAVFHDAVQELMSQLNSEASNYEIMRLERLLLELDEFFADENSESGFDDVAKYVASVAQIKSLLFNTDHRLIGAQEWTGIGSIFSTAYVASLRFKIFFDSQSLYDVTKLGQMRAAIDDVISILRQGFVRREGRPITVRDLEPLLLEIEKVGMMPLDMTAQSATQFIGRVFDFILNPQNQFPASGLSSEKLTYIEEQIENWSRVQKTLVNQSTLPDLPAWQEMEKVLATPWAVSMDPFGRIIIDGEKDPPTNLQGQTRLNLGRALFGLIFRAYIEDPKRRGDKMQMSRQELSTAVTDLMPILAGLGLTENGDTEFDERIYRDANLFMPRSDGNRFLGFYEIIEYLHFVYSGLDAGEIMIEQMDSSCKVDEEKVDVGCFRSFFQSNKENQFVHLPFYLKYARKLSAKDFLRDIRNIEITNRDEGASPAPIKNSDIYETFVMLQYIEVIMLRYDTNQSGGLDLFEGLKALELFKNVIGGFLNLDPEKPADMLEIEVLFTYMLKYGEFPNPDDPLAQLKLSNWRWQKKKWELAADRGILFQILATISRMGSI